MNTYLKYKSVYYLHETCGCLNSLISVELLYSFSSFTFWTVCPIWCQQKSIKSCIQEWFPPGNFDLRPSRRSFSESTSFYVDTDPVCMLDTHHTADITIHRFYTVYQKRSKETQYGYNHLGVYEIMIHNSYMISPKKVIRTSKWVQSFRFLQYNDTQLLYGD